MKNLRIECGYVFLQGRGQNTLYMGRWLKSATVVKWEWNIIGDLCHVEWLWRRRQEKKEVKKEVESDEWGRLVTFVIWCIVEEVVEVYLHLRKCMRRKRKVVDSETYILLLMGYMYLTYQNTQKWQLRFTSLSNQIECLMFLAPTWSTSPFRYIYQLNTLFLSTKSIHKLIKCPLLFI